MVVKVRLSVRVRVSVIDSVSVRLGLKGKDYVEGESTRQFECGVIVNVV